MTDLRDTGNSPLTAPRHPPVQHALPGLQSTPTLWPCDICNATGRDHGRRCPVCDATGSLTYDPAGCDTNPFHGLEAA